MRNKRTIVAVTIIAATISNTIHHQQRQQQQHHHQRQRQRTTTRGNKRNATPIMWGAIAAWVACLASLSLPWPGVVLCAILCCLIFFEFASPAAWSKKRRGSNTNNDDSSSRSSNADAGGGAGGGIVESVATAGVRLLNWMLERLQVQVRLEVRSGKIGVKGGSGGGGGGCEGKNCGAKPRSGQRAVRGEQLLFLAMIDKSKRFGLHLDCIHKSCVLYCLSVLCLYCTQAVYRVPGINLL